MVSLRVLLDENLPRRLKNLLPPEIEGETVRERGWGSIKNGALLALAQQEFDALLTADQGIPNQHDLSRFDLVVVVPIANRNDFEHLSPLMRQATEALRSTAAGGVARIATP